MHDDREDVFSKAVRAGKRTYFFDVKSTRGRDLYLTITESKKHTHDDGTAHYDKHKIFLYKEDFEKFRDGLTEAFDEIDRLKGTGDYIQEDNEASRSSDPYDGSRTNDQQDAPRGTDPEKPFTDLNFEDLGDK